MLDECDCSKCSADDLLIPTNKAPPPPGLAFWNECRSSPTLVPAMPTPPRRLIAFTGLAGSGKSTAALHLVKRHGWQRRRFAGPLKAMMAALGLSEQEIEGHLKETPCPLLCGRTPRYAMQTIGTEWGRDTIGEDLWIHAFRAALPASGNIVVDDCRFANEAAAVRAAGGHIVRIVRPGAGAGAAGHSSEGQELPWTSTVVNNCDLSEFLTRIDRGVLDLSWVEV